MGRKGWEKELKSKALWKLSTDILIKALKYKKRNGEEEKVSLKEKIHIAIVMVNKMLPADMNVEHSGSVKLTEEERKERIGRLRDLLSTN